MQPAGVVDEAIHHLDSTSEPWSVHLEVHLEAALDEERLRQAVQAAIERHPRARSRWVAAARWRQPYVWQVGETTDVDPLDVVEGAGEDDLTGAREELEGRPIPLGASPPLRLRLVRRPGAGDVLMLNLHHAAGDGIAALVFIQSVARAYGCRPEVVADVAMARATAYGRSMGARELRVLVTELGQVARSSARMAADGGDEAPGYRFHLLSLGPARTRALVECAAEGTTVNDLLLAALHLTVDAWNREHGAPTRRISVLVPVNLRSQERWREGFANATLPVPVSTRRQDRLHPAVAVEAVRRRTRWIKDERSPLTAVSALQRLQALPRPARRWVARQASREQLTPTILLSNLGRLRHDLDFGPGVGGPSRAWFSPPARMPLGVAIGAMTVGEELGLAFRVRRPLLGPEATIRFAADYQSALDRLVDARLSARPRLSPRRAA